jgi:hypothetical protein
MRTSRNCKRYFATAPSGMHPLGSVCSGLLPGNVTAFCAAPREHILQPPSAPLAATDRPRLFPRAPRGRGAARLALGLDRRLRMGEGRASAVPWGDGFGKGDWVGWRGAIANGMAHTQRGETPRCYAHVAPEPMGDGWAESLSQESCGSF